MNYLIKIGNPQGLFGLDRKEIKLKNMPELKEFMLLLPDEWEVISVNEIPIYNTLADYKVELEKIRTDDIEKGSISQT